ncbi:diguanylate cyclase [Methylobacterium sp. Leaf456]|uniref:GAF domain-containing protein n=1 Tax=Methylobacterium sp. Leaf456 TaxID=1736382 RepID=UPI0006FE3254|nr:GAF domain-containing protein [Methylobacterium sp. Leaf456]KQT56928.1 diguanylate cyclase [Methylobacterium sp. Leaf456]
MVNAYPKADPALERTAALLADARSADEVVEILRLTARRIAGSDGIAVVLRDGRSCFYAAEDAIEPLWRGCRFPLDACVSGWAMLNDETVVIPDIGIDPRVPQPAYANKAICSLAMVPIGTPEPVAALGAYWCAMVLLDPTTLTRIETLARQAGEALARVRGEALAAAGAGRSLQPEAAS